MTVLVKHRSYCEEHDAVFEAGPEWTEPNPLQLKNIACHPEIPYGTFKGDGEPDWVQNALGLWVMDFDGNDYIDTGITRAGGMGLFAAATEKWTTGVWFKIAEGASGHLFSRASTNRTYQMYFDRSGDAANTPIIYLRNTLTRTNLDLDDGTWHILWVTWDGSTAEVCYDDNQGLVGLNVGWADEDTDQKIFIGSKDGAVGGLTGSTALPRIYPRALGLGEIRNKYEREKAMFGL